MASVDMEIITEAINSKTWGMARELQMYSAMGHRFKLPGLLTYPCIKQIMVRGSAQYQVDKVITKTLL